MVFVTVVGLFGILIAALVHPITALPPDVPYKPFWEVGEQSGFEVRAPLGRYIPQLSAGPDLVLRPTPSKAQVSGSVTSSYFTSSGSARSHVIVVEAHVWLTDEPVLVTVPGGVLVNDTRSNGGAGMCTTLGLLKPVKIYPGQPQAKFKVYLEPVPRDDDPSQKYAPGVPIIPWFEVQSDYERRTNVPSAAFEWAHVVRLSNYLHKEQVNFRDVDRAFIKDVVSDAFAEGFSAPVKAKIMSSWKEYLNDVERRGGPKYLWTRPEKLDWDKVTQQPHPPKGAHTREEVELLQVSMATCNSPKCVQGSASSVMDHALTTLDWQKTASRDSVHTLMAAVVLILIGGGVAIKMAEVGIKMSKAKEELSGGESGAQEKAEESYDNALASKRIDDGLASGVMRPKRPTRRGRGVLRKKFEAMQESPGQGRAQVDTADAVSIPETASELLYPRAA